MAYVLTYRNEFDDYAAMIQAKRSGPMGVYGPYVVTTLLFLVFMALLQIWEGGHLADLLDPLAVVFILAGIPMMIAIVALINFVFLRGVYRLIFRRFALANAEITVRLDDDGVHWKGNGFSGALRWVKVRTVVERGDRLFLFISKAEALILPKRGLAAGHDFEGLKTYVKSHVHD